jgi:signal transduction histidine kinase
LLVALRSIGEETDRLSQLAEDLLLLNRIDEGRLPLHREPIALDELLNSVATRFQRRAGETGRQIDTAGHGLLISGDPLRLEQALGNLVENALRYGAGTTRLFADAQDARLEIHVTDEGDGLPLAFAPRAFERFSRANDARHSAGAGLGLAIVKAIAEAHGATVATTNRAEGGADICLSFPSNNHRPL